MSEPIVLSPLAVYELTDDRRTRCLLCGGRCDPTHWTCSHCHRRLADTPWNPDVVPYRVDS
jgi:hypothetical protein